jgi:hypothetical protein
MYKVCTVGGSLERLWPWNWPWENGWGPLSAGYSCVENIYLLCDWRRPPSSCCIKSYGLLLGVVFLVYDQRFGTTCLSHL